MEDGIIYDPDAETVAAAIARDALPPECEAYMGAHSEHITYRACEPSTYVRLQRNAGCVRLVVPFPVGTVRSREKTFRLSDHMDAADLLAHAKYVQKMWSKKSLAMRAQFLTPKQAARLRAPDADGCLGVLRYRRPRNQFVIAYVDNLGYMQHKPFHVSHDELDDRAAVFAIRDRAVAFVEEMIRAGTGTPIRRKFRRPMRRRETNLITQYFSRVVPVKKERERARREANKKQVLYHDA